MDILCSNSRNLKNNITKIEHKKIICSPSKISKNNSLPINICLKYFMTPTKALQSPSYILNVRYLIVIFFFFKCLFIITKENYNPLLWRKCSLRLYLKKSEFLKGFFNLYVFGFLFTIINKNYDLLWWRKWSLKLDYVRWRMFLKGISNIHGEA